MIRPILTELALFLAPFVVYALYLVATNSRVWDLSAWPPKTLATLAIIALILMIGSFIYLSHFAGVPPGTEYIPAHVDERGNFIPGTTR